MGTGFKHRPLKSLGLLALAALLVAQHAWALGRGFPQRSILLVLAADVQLDMGCIARRAVMSDQTLRGVLGRMERAGLVSRGRLDADAHAYELSFRPALWY